MIALQCLPCCCPLINGVQCRVNCHKNTNWIKSYRCAKIIPFKPIAIKCCCDRIEGDMLRAVDKSCFTEGPTSRRHGMPQPCRRVGLRIPAPAPAGLMPPHLPQAAGAALLLLVLPCTPLLQPPPLWLREGGCKINRNQAILISNFNMSWVKKSDSDSGIPSSKNLDAPA